MRREKRANQFLEASRAKHKFAVKRNSWPKTRGVAMNPVDHVSFTSSGKSAILVLTGVSLSLTAVVIINISVKHLLSRDTQRKDRKPASSRLGGLVYFVVLKRRRIRCSLRWVLESRYVGVRSNASS